MLQTHPFSGVTGIAASGSMLLYQRCDTAGAVDQDIEVAADGRWIGNMAPGDRMALRKPANKWEVRPITAGLSGRLVIGDGHAAIMRNRGPRELLRPGFESSLAGVSYFSAIKRQAVAGKYASILLTSELAKLVSVNALHFMSDVATSVLLYTTTGTDPATWVSTAPVVTKNLEQVAAHSALYTFDQVSFASPSVPNQTIDLGGAWEYDVSPNSRVDLILSTPIVMKPGVSNYGSLLFVSKAAGGSLSLFVDLEII